MDERCLLAAPPAFDLLLARDGVASRVIAFIKNQPVEIVPCDKARPTFDRMLPKATLKDRWSHPT